MLSLNFFVARLVPPASPFPHPPPPQMATRALLLAITAASLSSSARRRGVASAAAAAMASPASNAGATPPPPPADPAYEAAGPCPGPPTVVRGSLTTTNTGDRLSMTLTLPGGSADKRTPPWPVVAFFNGFQASVFFF